MSVLEFMGEHPWVTVFVIIFTFGGIAKVVRAFRCCPIEDDMILEDSDD